MVTDDIRYPVGKFRLPGEIDEEQVKEAITILQVFPEKIKQLTYSLDDGDLNRPYREGGWTIRQLIHHISDSHHHAYNRLRWALSEKNPTIKAYDQDAFAQLSDYSNAPVAWSFQHLEAVHRKMVYIFELLTEEQWNRTFRHPEMEESMNIKGLALMYAWHSMHHYAHIKNALKV